MRVAECFSQDLLARMAELTAKQRAAIPRLVRALAEGQTMRELLQGPDRICCWSTYYRPERGWYHQPVFRSVLQQAQNEYDSAILRLAVDEAAEVLRRATPLAAQVLQAEVMAGLQAQRDGEPVTFEERKLRLLVDHAEEGVALRALALLLRERGQTRQRGMRAAAGVLDRADVETAVKSAGAAEAEWRDLLEELRGLSDDGEVANVGAEVGDLPAAGVPSARGAGGGTPGDGAGVAGGGRGEVGEVEVDG